MSTRGTHRYGLRFDESRIPTAVITRREDRASNIIANSTYSVWVEIKRMRGFTTSHASRRAFNWMRKHGDPR